MSDTVTTALTPWDYGLDGFWIDEELKDDYKGLPTADGAPASITLSNGLILTQFNGERYQDQFGDLWDLIFWDYPEYYTFVIGTPKDYGLLECTVKFFYEYGAGTLPTNITFSKFYSPLSNIVSLKIWFDTPTEDSPDKVVLRYAITNSDGLTTVWREGVSLKDWFTEYNNAYFKIIPSSTTFVPPTSEAATIVVGGDYSVSLFNSEDNALVTTYTDTTLSKTAEALFVVFTGYPNPYTSETGPTITVKDPTSDNTLCSASLPTGTYTATLTTSGLSRKLSLTNSSEEVQTLQWSNSAPAGKVINAIGNDSTVIIANSEQTVSISIDSDTTFYEEYVDLPTSSGTVVLYNNEADPRRLDKTNYLRLLGDITGTFRSDTNVVNPIFRFQGDSIDFNYVYISSLRRYYYVTGSTYIGNRLWEVSLQCDVLMTYREGITSCYAFVDRTEDSAYYNTMIVDSDIPFKQGQTVETHFINNGVFTSGVGQLVLTGFLVSPAEAAATTELQSLEIYETDESEVETDE